jgi:hypothetical protein
MADPTTVEMCLQLTDSPTEVCGLSSASGKLAGIFFDATVLEVPRSQLGFESGEIGIGQRCREDNVTACGLTADISGMSAAYRFNLGLEVGSGGQWTGNRSAYLGCFYMTGARSIQLLSSGWDLGLSFVNTDGSTYSRMYKPLFSPNFPQLGLPGSGGAADLRLSTGCDYGVINVRVPTGDAHAQSCLSCTEVTLRMVDYQLAEVSACAVLQTYFIYVYTYK